MDTISLRAYYSEIESMIERGRTKDAIVHCRHILKTYPRSIDTYRLMGKAYLEAQRFSEGADVLQRVLSAVPDDFVSQIGLSIIREDEGNLDAALWHMERAFEAQPSNKAVQDELRRLYGRRDGVQPTKIRLTRGALVRMYARGELYQQAIAEARMALVEQPDRVDIELILARMYYLSNQKISATEICSRLLAKLPFCYEANKILTEILPGTAREDEIDIYRRHLYDLDPYLEFTPPGSTSSANAPEESIMVEPLELDEAKLAAEHPELVDEDKEQLPEWLAALETKETFSDDLTQMVVKGKQAPGITGGISQPAKPVEPVANEDDQIPEWMKEAGWEPSDEVQEEAEIISEEVAEEIASEAEIPEWLQSIAPSEETSSIFGADETAGDEEDTRWLESILDGEVSSQETIDDSNQNPEARGVADFKEVAEKETDVFKSQDLLSIESLPQENLPPEIEEEFVDLEVTEELLGSEREQGSIPDWLAGMADVEGKIEEEPADEPSPDTGWLKSLAEEEKTPAEPEPSTFTHFEGEPEQPFEGEPMGEEEIEIDTDWLKRLPTEDETSNEFETPPVEAVQSPESEPKQPDETEAEGVGAFEIDNDWIKNLSAEEEPSDQIEPIPGQYEQPSEIVSDQTEAEKDKEGEFKVTTDWLKRLPEDQEEEPEEQMPAKDEVFAMETEGDEEADFESDDQSEVQKFPADDDWIKRLAFEEKETSIEGETLDMGEELEEPEPLEDEEEIEEFTSDFDWLKHISSDEQIPPETLESAEAEEVVEPQQAELEADGTQESSSEVDWLKPISDDEKSDEFEIKQITEESEEIEQPSVQPSEPAEEESTLKEAEQEGIEISPEESEHRKPMTAEEFLLEVKASYSAEQGDTQPTHITPPSLGGESIEDFIAKLDEPKELASESLEKAAEITDLSDDIVPEELELSAAELEDILPESVADDNFDHGSGSEIPDWLKESLDIDAGEPQSTTEGETPDLAGIPGAFPTKTPEELALDEILAASEEISEEDIEEIEPPITPPVVEKPFKEPEEVRATKEEPVEDITSLDDEEDRGLLSWLAEDSAEAEAEFEEEEIIDFVPPPKEDSEWVKEEPLIESPEIIESMEAEFHEDELAEKPIEEAPEEEFEELPDWLMAMAEDKEPQPEITETKEEVIPEWLVDLEEPEIEEFSFEEKPQEQIPEQPEAVEPVIQESYQKPAEEPFEPTPEESLENQDLIYKTGGEAVKPSDLVVPADEEPLEVSPIIFKAEGKPVEPAQQAEPEVEESEEIPELSYQTEGTEVQPVDLEEPVEHFEEPGEDISPLPEPEPPKEIVSAPSGTSDLYNAQAALNVHDLENALSYYNQLIERGESLEDVVHDLRDALEHYPVDISIWQALGDAYMRSNQLQEALDAYTKAEELMR